jgi:hypothetical protein
MLCAADCVYDILGFVFASRFLEAKAVVDGLTKVEC